MMTPQDYEVDKELRRRKAQRKRREMERQRAEQEQKKLKIRLAVAGVVLVLVAALIFAFASGWLTGGEDLPEQTTHGTEPVHTTQGTEPVQTQQTTPPPETTAPSANNTVIHIAAAGDLNVTDRMVENALTLYGHDFTSAFLDVAPVLSQADLTVLNLEGNFGSYTYGTETGAAPAQLAEALAAMGVDAVQTANSAAIRAGVLGLQSTISTLKRVGIEAVGTFADASDFRSSGGYTIMEVKGLRIALVGFTKGMDNLGLPEGSESCVNLLYEDYTTTYSEINTDGIRKVLRNVAEEQPDLVIAMVHWGSEYNEMISKSQIKIRKLLLENGVDVILGTHSHLLKAVEHDKENNTLVAWSLGDFYGDAQQAGSNYSVILDIEVTKDNTTGEVRISGYSHTPIYTVQPEESSAGGQRVVRIHEAMARYDGNYLGKVTPQVYSAMDHALKRIEQRLVEKVGS